MIIVACIGYMLHTCCTDMKSCVVCCTDMKQRRLFSPVPKTESSSVIVIAPSSSLSSENTQIDTEQMQSVSIKSEHLTASTSAVVTGTEFTEHPVASPTAENVNASMSQLSLVSDADTVPPADSSETEPDDAKMQQLTAVKSEITATRDEDAAVSITSNDVSVNDPDVLRSSMQPAAASVDEQTEQAPLQQQVAANSQDTEADCGDQTSTDVGDVASSHASTYQTDVAMHKQEASSNDASDTAGGKQEARSDSASETFISCAPPLSPCSSDSVFYSPQSNISDNKNTSNNKSPSAQKPLKVQHSSGDTVTTPFQSKMLISDNKNTNNDESPSAQKPQGVQHSSGDSVMTSSQSKQGIYNRCDSSVVGERKETESECSQSMTDVESKTDKDAVNCHSKNNMVVESEEPVEDGDSRDKGSEVDDSFEDDDDEEEQDKISDDVKQDESGAGEKMAVEPQKSKNETSTSDKASKKRKKRRRKKQPNKQSHSANGMESESSNSVKNEADDVETCPIARPPEMQSDTVNTVRQTASETAESASDVVTRGSGDDADANANGTNDAASHQNSQNTADTCSNQQKHVQTASSPDASNAEVRKYIIFDVLY